MGVAQRPMSAKSSSSDCFSCKVVGASACFGGSVYALYERTKIKSKYGRHWLLALSIS